MPVLAGEGDHCLGEGVQQAVGDEVEVLAGGHAGDTVGAEAVYGGLDDHVGDGEDHALKTCREADLDNALQIFRHKFQPGRVEPEFILLVHQEVHHHARGETVGQYGGQGHTDDVQMKTDYEEEIQDNIHHAGDGQADEGTGAVPLASQDGGTEIVQHDGRHAQEVDAQVQHGQVHDVLRRAHQVQQGVCHKNTCDQQKSAGGQGHGNDCVNRVADLVTASLPQQVGDHHVRADREPQEKVDHQADDGGVAAHGRHGLGIRETADNGKVCGIEQLLQHAADRQRQGKQDHFFRQRAVDHVQVFAAGMQMKNVHGNSPS